ncbi:BLUF domain-containing protein [Acinetobacter cumulans]|uniref:BLUF domain-containing protein n=1 Tax=Acinetobacter cumulans TaxID=2136182 RepID=A0A3A8G8Z5_9GAMM|nr:BLUF domain-containing protein [Acinetobacter cumulans]RKG49463.1 BLUF domain-containing protein [Acinetobacter cumulans]
MMQLCYASTRQENQKDLLEDLSDILVSARNFNQAHEIYGVLYYAEGRFFQCLEAEAEILEKVYAKIASDPRHTNLIRFENRVIDRLHFSEWSMKYVNKHSSIGTLFKRFGLNAFLPHELKTEQIPVFLELLLRLQNSEPKLKRMQGYRTRGYKPYF